MELARGRASCKYTMNVAPLQLRLYTYVNAAQRRPLAEEVLRLERSPRPDANFQERVAENAAHPRRAGERLSGHEVVSEPTSKSHGTELRSRALEHERNLGHRFVGRQRTEGRYVRSGLLLREQQSRYLVAARDEVSPKGQLEADIAALRYARRWKAFNARRGRGRNEFADADRERRAPRSLGRGGECNR